MESRFRMSVYFARERATAEAQARRVMEKHPDVVARVVPVWATIAGMRTVVGYDVEEDWTRQLDFHNPDSI